LQWIFAEDFPVSSYFLSSFSRHIAKYYHFPAKSLAKIPLYKGISRSKGISENSVLKISPADFKKSGIWGILGQSAAQKSGLLVKETQ